MYFNTSDTRIPLRPNDVVQISEDKRFVIDKCISGGGYCLMYLAHREGSGRYVALKELYPSQVKDAFVQRLDNGHILIWNPFSDVMGMDDTSLMEEFSQYFYREVQLSRKAGGVNARDGQKGLQNNPDVLQVDGPMTDTRGNLYLAIDTYQGESLRDYIERGFVRDQNGNVLSNQFLEEIIHILSETAIRLSALHDAGQMYHLDLSADNIYLAFTAGQTRRQPYIIDYGSAFDRSNPGETVDHRYTVNPHSAPEILALAEAPDPAGYYRADESSDTYSLVSILFYAATGHIFTPEMRMYGTQWKDRIVNEYSSGIPQEATAASFAFALIRFFEKGLASDQRNRFRSAKALRSALEELETSFREYGNLLPLVPKDELMSYLVLEKHPLYHYRSADGDMHVLCLGSGVFVKRMILSLISCGQMIDSRLHIHIVSNEPEETFQKALLVSAPELIRYSNLAQEPEREYVIFHYTQVEDILSQETGKSVLSAHRDAHYMLISLGKSRLNTEAAQMYAQLLTRENAVKPRKTIINYYCAEDIVNGTATAGSGTALPEWLEVDAFADDLASYTGTQRELGLRAIRLAHIYNRENNPGISLAETARQVARDAYGQKSSCAAAVHLKYKLAGLGIDPESGKDSVIAAYLRALQGSRYEKLLENEHNRWMMHMVSEQYRKPTTEELRRFGFEMEEDRFNGSWKSTQLLRHPCLVPCGGGIKLTPEDWEAYNTEEKIAASSFDELDKVSLLLRCLSAEKCREILNSDILDQQFAYIQERLNTVIRQTQDRQEEAQGDVQKETPVPHPLEQLQKKLENVRRFICNAAWSLQYSEDYGQLEDLRESFDGIGVNISGEIKLLREKLAVFREYASMRDYKEADATIVRNLLWLLYAEGDVSLIKLCGKTISSNITAPLVIDPENLIYYGIEQQPEWISFLRSHGYCGQVSFAAYTGKTVDGICEDLQGLIDRQLGKVILDITDAEETAVVAVQRIAERRDNVAVIRASTEGKIENIRNFPEAPMFMLNTKITADDIYELHGAKRTSFENNYMDRLYEYVPALWEVYQEFRDDWVNITAFFAHKRANFSELYVSGITVSPEETWETWSSYIGREHWNSLDLTDVFERIEAKGIIRDLSIRDVTPGRLKITFQYPAASAKGYLATAISNFFRNVLPRAFAPFTCEITGNSEWGYTLNVKSGYVVNLRDTDLTFSDKRNRTPGKRERISYRQIVPALERLEQIGILSDLNVFIQAEPVARVNISFVYANLAAKQCLQTAGNILELYIWYEAKRAHFFDSIQNNYCLTWKEGIQNELDVILTRGLTSLIISAKTAKFSKEHLYEIKYLTDRFSLNSKAVIVYSSSAAVEDGCITDNLQPVKDRARAMGIYLISLNELEGSLRDKLIRIATGQDLP